MRSYDLIAIEDPKIKDMTRSAKGTAENPGKNVKANAGLNRSILEQSWGLFRKRLTDKATNALVPVEVKPINLHTRASVALSVVTLTKETARVKRSSVVYRVATQITQT